MGDHSRVLEILHQVDLTADQRLQNQELRDAVLDAEDAVCLLEQQLRVRQLNADCVAAIQTAQQCLQRFESEISFAHSTTRQDEEQYARECGLLVDGRQFLSEEGRLTSLRGLDVARDRLARIEPLEHSELARYFVDGAGKVLAQAEQVALEHRIDTSPWAMVMDSALNAVASHVRANAVALRPLEALDGKIAELRAAAAQELREQHQAIEAGDVVRSEEHVKARMALLEGVSDVIQHKFKVLAQIEAGPLVKAQTEAQRAQEQLPKAAVQVFCRFDAHLANLEADLERLEQYRGRATQNEREARAAFAEQRAASDKVLAGNLERQTACWREMLRLEAELSALAEQRREEVERRVRAYEREERRRCDTAHFLSFAGGRQKQLRAAIDSIVTEKRVGAALADLVDKAVYTLSEEVAVMHRGVKETKRAVLGEHAGHFREQYLAVGELLFRKERLLEECDKKIAELRMQQEVAMDSLDPKARYISEQRSALEQQRDEVARLVELLRSKTDMYVDAFRPSDVVIRSTSGISGNNNNGGGGGGAGGFTHSDPVEELRRMNEERSRTLDKYFSHMTQEAGKTEQALHEPKRAGEWRVHPKYLASQEEIDLELAEIDAAKEILARTKRRTLAELQWDPETDPRTKAQRRRSMMAARRLSIGGDAEDPPATLLAAMHADEQRQRMSVVAEASPSHGKRTPAHGDGDEIQLPESLVHAVSPVGVNRSSGAAATPTPASTRANANNNDGVGGASTAKRPQQRYQQRAQQQQQHASPASLGGAAAEQPRHVSSVAERLNAALRASALGLNESLEPCQGRALDALQQESIALNDSESTSVADSYHATPVKRRGIEPEDPNLFDELGLRRC